MKKIEFHVMGRFEASTFMLDEPHIHIAVWTPGSFEVPLPENPKRIGVLQLCFHDVSKVSDREWLANELKGTGVDVVLFTDDMARQIAEFVQTHSGVEHIAVNCDAGACRSPAIAAAISKKFTGDDEVFFKRYSPNHHVFRTLLSHLREAKR